MGIFDRFRKPQDGGASMAPDDSPVESIQRMRRRAIQRLIGSCILVAIGVGFFAVMFDRQPRPVAVDIPIEIPDKKTIKPQALPAKPPASAASAAPASAAPSSPVAPEKSLADGEKILPNGVTPAPESAPKKEATNPVNTSTEAKKDQKSGSQTPATSPAKPDAAALAAKQEAAKQEAAKQAAKAEAAKAEAAKQEAARQESARARALLEGASTTGAKAAATAQPATTAPASEGAPRYIVQFGSFAEAARAQEARKLVEKAGLKTYAQEATTESGKRIRTRVGPFATRAEADAAATKIKALGLPASVLTL